MQGDNAQEWWPQGQAEPAPKWVSVPKEKAYLGGKPMRLQIQREGYSEAGGMGCFKQVRTKIVSSEWANSGMPSHT